MKANKENDGKRIGINQSSKETKKARVMFCSLLRLEYGQQNTSCQFCFLKYKFQYIVKFDIIAKFNLQNYFPFCFIVFFLSTISVFFFFLFCSIFCSTFFLFQK